MHDGCPSLSIEDKISDQLPLSFILQVADYSCNPDLSLHVWHELSDSDVVVELDDNPASGTQTELGCFHLVGR